MYLSPTFNLEYQDWKEIAIELSVIYDRINMIKDKRKGPSRNENPKTTMNPPWREKNQNRPSNISWRDRMRVKMPQTRAVTSQEELKKQIGMNANKNRALSEG